MLTVVLALTLGRNADSDFAMQSATFHRKATRRGGVVLTFVPEGEFITGSDDGPSEERPKHRVYLDGYWIGVNVVTVAQFKTYCADRHVDFSKVPVPKWGWNDDNPMVNVAWSEARDYCKWAGGDLPTEAQWEKAARGVDGRPYPWGNEWSSDNLWCSKRTPMDAGGTTQIGIFPQGISPFGCLDMEGNVFQWCRDQAMPYDVAANRNPTGSTSGPSHVLRGGSWALVRPESFRVTTRTLFKPTRPANNEIGFRVVVSGVSG